MGKRKKVKARNNLFTIFDKIGVWWLLPASILISEFLTLSFTLIYHWIFVGDWPTKEIIYIVMWDGGFVPLVGVAFIIYILDKYRRLREENIQLEEEVRTRKKFTEKLNVSEKRYRAIYEQAALGIYNMDADGRILTANQRFCEMIGYSEEELRELTYLDITHDEDKGFSQKAFRTTVEKGKIVTGLEKRYVRKDGEVIHVIISNAFLKDEKGNTLYSISTVNDVTESVRLRLEKENMAVNMRNQQKLESIGILAGGVAHEINNPINGIMNYGQLIVDSTKDDELSTYSKEIIRETERVSRIVKNLLAFSRHEEKDLEYYSIKKIIGDTLSLVRTIIKKDQITLQVEVPDDLPDILCNGQQLQQVIMNLVTNARDSLNEKYTGFDNNKIIRITAAEKKMNGKKYIDILVEDHGKGIPADIKDKIFDPFFTTKGRDRGTGLGLSISYGIVKDHGGELDFKTKKGQYTKFHIFIPIQDELSEDNI